MQSYLQYRAIGRAVQAQLESSQEKALALTRIPTGPQRQYSHDSAYHAQQREPLRNLSRKPTSQTVPRLQRNTSTLSNTLGAVRTRDFQPGHNTPLHPEEDARQDSHEDIPEELENDELQDTALVQPHIAGDPTLEEGIVEDVDLEALHNVTTARSERNILGPTLTGIDARDRTTREGKDGEVFVVGWAGPHDPLNPRNFSTFTKVLATLRIACLCICLLIASSIDASVLPQAAADLHVSEVVESLATAMFLAGLGVGCLTAGPLSETFGRNFVYIGTLVFFMGFEVGAALAPNIGAQIVFRFLAGFAATAPLTLAGGTIADLFSPLEKTYGFPVYGIAGFAGPALGPVLSAYIGDSTLSWRWAEWISLILGFIAWLLIGSSQPETYAPILLKWKAQQLRAITNDTRYSSELEILNESLWTRLQRALARPFVLIKSELIIVLMTIYLTFIWIILFTFLDGYPYIFQDVYGTSQGLTFTIFAAMVSGIASCAALVPPVYAWTKAHRSRSAAGKISPETRLWFAMLGAPLMPASIFLMGWSDYASVSIWAPILGSALFGLSCTTVFLSANMYVIDAYEVYAASALTFVALVRYVVAAGMTVVGIPFYENLGVHWTLTILGCVSVPVTAIPYALYVWGPRLRRFSKFAIDR